MPERYQYGTRINGRVEPYQRRRDAENAARDWAISPLRTGPRKAELVRRRGWTFPWGAIATWSSPEAYGMEAEHEAGKHDQNESTFADRCPVCHEGAS
jgi:hypothetical protein